jgi:hypothetical protein
MLGSWMGRGDYIWFGLIRAYIPVDVLGFEGGFISYWTLVSYGVGKGGLGGSGLVAG